MQAQRHLDNQFNKFTYFWKLPRVFVRILQRNRIRDIYDIYYKRLVHMIAITIFEVDKFKDLLLADW